MREPPFSDSLMQPMLDAIPVGVLVLDRTGRVLMYNLSASSVLGWRGLSVLGQDCHAVLACGMPESDSRMVSCPVEHVCSTGNPVWIPRARVRAHGGEWKWVELSAKPLGSSRPWRGVIVTIRDLSPELQMVEAVQRLASIPEECPFPIIEVDADCHIHYANPAMVALMERGGIGRSGLSPALPEHFPRVVRDSLTTNAPQQDLEVTVGSRVYSWLLVPHVRDGLVRGYGLDVTDRKVAADELAAFADMVEAKNRELDRALVDAEAAKRAKAAFLAAMSHEIRTPLNGVLGMTDVLLDMGLTAEQRECAEVIKHSASGLRALINDILDFSKIEAGKLELENIAFDVESVLEEVLELVAESAHRKGLDLAGTLDPAVPPLVLGDPTRLRQVLLNLAGNAVKFTEQGGVRLDVTLAGFGEQEDFPAGRRHERDESGSAGERIRLLFTVTDTGIGLHPDAKDRIFEKFTQADVSTTRKYGGTGLGLAICKQLVELMGGTIGVDSRVGHGATFWFSLPVQVHERVQERSGWMRDGSNDEIRGRRIGLVGLPPFTKAAVIDILHRAGMTIDVADDPGTVAYWLGENTCVDAVPEVLVASADVLEQWEMVDKISSRDTSGPLGIVVLVPIGGSKPAVPESLRERVRPMFRPVRRQCLLGQIRDMCRRPAPAASAHVDASASCRAQRLDRPGSRFFSRRGAPCPRVLVADDNPVNQRVVGWMLGKLGCQATFVTTGREAVEMTGQVAYDAVLMDWQMPEMDGLEATRIIRERERARAGAMDSDFGRLPIIGMTANAMKGDRETCLDAGMDDYLTKPIRLEDLQIVLQPWFAAPRPVPTAKPEAPATRDAQVAPQERRPEALCAGARESSIRREGSVYDVDVALRAMDHDADLLMSLIGVFLESGPRLMDEIEKAYAAGNREALKNHVHQMKGSLGALRAGKPATLAAQLEKSVAHDSAAMTEAYQRFRESVGQLFPVLAELRDAWSRPGAIRS